MRHVIANWMVAAAVAIGLAGTAAAAIAASRPTATTGTASHVSANGATVAGTINPNGIATTYAFQYGTTPNYGSQTAATQSGSGTSSAPVQATLSGLVSGT